MCATMAAMKLAFAADHAGVELKNALLDDARAAGHEVVDLGGHDPAAPDDYPDFAALVAGAVGGGAAERGVLVCGSGVGAAVAANKHRGIRAGLCHDGQVHAPGDAYAQARRCFSIVEKALRELDAELRHVVRTRMFVTDISRWKDFGRAHGEVFAKHPPTTSMIEIKGLIAPGYLIEVEADAYVY